MKKLLFTASALSCALLFGLGATSCGSDSKKDTPAATTAAPTSKSGTELPNYRYVDIDSVLSKYNLAKDYNEEMLRMQTNMESEVKRHENSIQSFATYKHKKMQKNGYLSEESYKADEAKFNKKQSTAQKYLATLKRNF